MSNQSGHGATRRRNAHGEPFSGEFPGISEAAWARTFGDHDWLASFGFSNDDLADFYTVSLHWSLAPCTPASMSVQPTTAAAR